LTLNSAKTLNLVFNPNVHTVTVTLTGTGGGVLASLETPTPAINCSWSATADPQQSGQCTAQYHFGDSFQINPTPDPLSHVNEGGITGDAGDHCASGSPPCTVQVGDSDIQINMTFDHVPVPVRIAISGNGSGSVSDAASGFTS